MADKKDTKADTKADTKKDEVKEPKGSTAGKIQKLKKQYDKILTDLFDEHASSCIEEALASSENAFGADIVSIVGTATDLLRGKVLADLGMEGEDCGCDMAVAGVMPDMGIGGMLGGPGKGIEIEVENEDEENEDEENEEEPFEPDTDDYE